MLEVSQCELAYVGSLIVVFGLISGESITTLWPARMSRLFKWRPAKAVRHSPLLAHRLVRYATVLTVAGAMSVGGFQLVTHTKLVPCHGGQEQASADPPSERTALAMCMSALNVQE